jgi:hypothetical protein
MLPSTMLRIGGGRSIKTAGRLLRAKWFFVAVTLVALWTSWAWCAIGRSQLLACDSLQVLNFYHNCEGAAALTYKVRHFCRHSEHVWTLHLVFLPLAQNS